MEDKIKQAGIELWRDYCAQKMKIEDLTEQRAELLEALVLIMPLAKGYAANNIVGSNAKYVEMAEEVIARHEGKI